MKSEWKKQFSIGGSILIKELDSRDNLDHYLVTANFPALSEEENFHQVSISSAIDSIREFITERKPSAIIVKSRPSESYLWDQIIPELKSESTKFGMIIE